MWCAFLNVDKLRMKKKDRTNVSVLLCFVKKATSPFHKKIMYRAVTNPPRSSRPRQICDGEVAQGIGICMYELRWVKPVDD